MSICGIVVTDKDIDKIITNIALSYASPADKKGTNTRCKLMGLDFFYAMMKLGPEKWLLDH